jgi:hypothetical protein
LQCDNLVVGNVATEADSITPERKRVRRCEETYAVETCARRKVVGVVQSDGVPENQPVAGHRRRVDVPIEPVLPETVVAAAVPDFGRGAGRLEQQRKDEQHQRWFGTRDLEMGTDGFHKLGSVATRLKSITSSRPYRQ